MPSVSTGTSTDDGGLWGQLLASVLAKSQLSSAKTIVMLGDRNSGRTSLVARLRGDDLATVSKNAATGGLDYTFFDVTEDETEDVIARVNVWQLEGDETLKGLLPLALNSNTIEDTLAAIVVDLSRPWDAAKTLRRWLSVLEQHINSLKDLKPKDLLETMRFNQVQRWQKYKEPDPASGKKRRKEIVSSRNKQQEKDASSDSAASPIPLPNEVLTNNLGIPVVVVCTKSDASETLQKDFDFKDGRLDYIQTYLRRICLNYGATLIYTSAKKDQGVDIFREYVEDIFFSFGFDHAPQLVEKEAIFVPAGWDSLDKIELDFKSQKVSSDLEQPFEEVITIPPNLVHQQETEESVTVTAKDDQEFLSGFLSVIEQEEKEAESAPHKEDGMIKSLRKIGKVEDVPASPAKDISLLTSKPSTPSLSGSAAALLSTQTPPRRIFSEPASSPKTPSGQTDNAALQSFFNNLLSKGVGKKAEPTGRKAAQRQEVEKGLQKLRQQQQPQPPSS